MSKFLDSRFYNAELGHKNTTALPSGHRSFRLYHHLQSHIWELTWNHRCWGSEISIRVLLLLMATARISIGLMYSSFSMSPASTVSLIDKVWVMDRICILAVRGASHVGRPSLSHLCQSKGQVLLGSWKEWKMFITLLYGHFKLIMNLNSWYFFPKLLVFS